ncbi:type VI secretion system baseplate subunit TssE [Orbaceae bacterium ac157xtp]
MPASLYELIYGFFDSDLELDEYDENEQTIISVMKNIERILNSRAGAITHIPDYGLPDMSMIFQALPSSAYVLMRAIQETLLKYEPRLARIEIKLDEKNKDTMVLAYELICHLKQGGLVKYGTHFKPDGKAELVYRQKAVK